MIAVILIGSLVSVSSLPLFGSSTAFQSISAFGMLQYSDSTNGKTWMKTVSWADGSRETVEVTDRGRIYLNGREVKTVGYNIWWGHFNRDQPLEVQEVQDNRVLDWCQENGIRFMVVDVDRGEIPVLARWMPKLYKHKMFVLLFVGNEPAHDVDVDSQYENFRVCVDAASEWADMIFAVGLPCWELSTKYNTETEVRDVLDPYLTQIFPLCRDYLRQSAIGDVPLVGKSAGHINLGTVCTFRHSDIPCWDFYSRSTSPNWTIEGQRIRWALEQSGKAGYQVWLTEHGMARDEPERVNFSNAVLYQPELLDYILAEDDPEFSMVMFWGLHGWDGDPYADWGAFYLDTGDPKNWTINLATYFSR